MDFPLFRLAEANLTFAEATIRAGGDKQAALSAINQLRKRAKATEITATDLTLDFVLDEKAREFYFEAQRRTDLIRYNKFTSIILGIGKARQREVLQSPVTSHCYRFLRPNSWQTVT